MRLDAWASSDPDRERLFYEWFFGKAFHEVVGQEPVANRTFTEIGDQRVLLRVFDEYGKYDDVPRTLRVIQGQEAPVAALDIEPNPVLAFDNVKLQRAADNRPERRHLQVPVGPRRERGLRGRDRRLVHHAPRRQPGRLPVTVRVIDQGGRPSTATGTVEVNPRPSEGGGSAPTAVLDRERASR